MPLADQNASSLTGRIAELPFVDRGGGPVMPVAVLNRGSIERAIYGSMFVPHNNQQQQQPPPPSNDNKQQSSISLKRIPQERLTNLYSDDRLLFAPKRKQAGGVITLQPVSHYDLYNFEQPAPIPSSLPKIVINIEKYKKRRAELLTRANTVDFSAPPTPVPRRERRLEQRWKLPPGWVPVCAKRLQREQCDQLKQAALEMDPRLLRNQFENMIGILNHPLVADTDLYGQTVRDTWNGSGKTVFLKTLVDACQKSGLSLKLAIVTYDMSTEGFLYEQVKSDLRLPCVRMNWALGEDWLNEFGILFLTSESSVQALESSDLDLTIVVDPRIRPGNRVFSALPKGRKVPVLRLVTLGSAEQRAQAFIEKDEQKTDQWRTEWWMQDPAYYNMLRDTNEWPSDEDAEEITKEAVESVLKWIKDGFKDPFEFSTSRAISGGIPVPALTADTTEPEPERRKVVEEPPAANVIPPPSEPQTTTTTATTVVETSNDMEMDEYEDMDIATTPSSEGLPQPDTAEDMVDELLSTPEDAASTPKDITTTDLPTAPEDTTTVQDTTTSNLSITAKDKAAIDLYTKKQIEKLFRYPILKFAGSKYNTQDTSDDESSSAYFSASEFEQPASDYTQNYTETSDFDNSSGGIAAVEDKVASVKAEYDKEVQKVMDQVQEQYKEAMEALKSIFMEQAYKQLTASSTE